MDTKKGLIMGMKALFNRLSKRLRKAKRGFILAFIIPAVALVLAVWLVLRAYKKKRKRKKNRPPRDTTWDAAFIPWHEFPDCRSEAPNVFVRGITEVSLNRTYGLTNNQLQWRRDKIDEFEGDVRRFMREYPSSSEELKQICEREA